MDGWIYADRFLIVLVGLLGVVGFTFTVAALGYLTYRWWGR